MTAANRTRTTAIRDQRRRCPRTTAHSAEGEKRREFARARSWPAKGSIEHARNEPARGNKRFRNQQWRSAELRDHSLKRASTDAMKRLY
jgi:hypothetical protein